MTAADRRGLTVPVSRVRSLVRFKVWQFSLVILLVAVAIRNVQDQRATEPALVALASVGFVAYGLLGWLGWAASRPLQGRLGETGRLVVYLMLMAALFLAATGAYLVLEYAYRNGFRF